MKAFVLGVLLASFAAAETTDPAYAPLSKAYAFLTVKDYDAAIPFFLEAITANPARPDVRKDLAYTYLKIGEAEAARDQFGEAMRLDPADTQVSLEFAFLCYESRFDANTWKATARRIFDRLRKQGNPTAEQAFQNVDRPLAAGIARWLRALELGTDNFAAHYDLAQLAEQRDQLDLAAEHYLKAWRLIPARKSVLVDLGRVLLHSSHLEEGHAALIAASRGGETRAAEMAMELLPGRYPYVDEFRRAIQFDPANVELHRELAYLLLKMAETSEDGERQSQQAAAEEEFRAIVRSQPGDLLSVAQLGFLYLGHKDSVQAIPLLRRVLEQAADAQGQDLANKVRTALHLDPVMEKRVAAVTEARVDARVMAEKSYAAGYIKDALKYLTVAHESDPTDYAVMLKLGYTENLLHNDIAALQWFSLARRSPDASIANPARKAYSGLRPNLSGIRTTFWLFPFYSSRWNDSFAYSQLKTEFRIRKFPIHPYVSVRFMGDSLPSGSGGVPRALSENSFIVGAGASANLGRGAIAWGEVGTAVSYLGLPQQKDIRGGIAWARLWGHGISSESGGKFLESNADGVFVSRYGNDFLLVAQNKAGFTLRRIGALHAQGFLGANLTQDTSRQSWANFIEAGPGFRFRFDGTPPSLVFTASFLRGVYTWNADSRPRPGFFDFRVGFWYAFTR